MPKPASQWIEDDVLSLPQSENDTFERKGSKLLDLTLSQVKEGHVLDELAKQLSAFGNAGGGQIIYGITNTGAVDNGGIARVLKGQQSTKEWLEDVIPILTDYEIVGCNVYEIPPKGSGSLLSPDKSIYVVNVPDSERAPHQSTRDLKYYIRLGGKSLPASHRLIEDIRNRSTYPKLEVQNLRIVGAAGSPVAGGTVGLKSQLGVSISISFIVRNNGRVRASTSCLQFSSTIPLSLYGGGGDCFMRSSVSGTGLLELRNPMYPGMEVPLGCIINVPAEVEVLAQGESLTLGAIRPEDVVLSITSFADSAPARIQKFKLDDPESHLVRVKKEEAGRIQRDPRSRFFHS